MYGVAACFSADPDGTVRLPFETSTGRLIEPVWQRWLDWDPVRMVPRHAEALRSLRAIWWMPASGTSTTSTSARRRSSTSWRRSGSTPGVFELFDAGHGAIEYRYPLAMRFLAEHLAR